MQYEGVFVVPKMNQDNCHIICININILIIICTINNYYNKLTIKCASITKIIIIST